MININYNKLLYDALPIWFRTGITYNFLQVAFKGLKDNWDNYYLYAIENDYELKHTSQKLSFEQYLNHHVPTNSGITLGDGIWSEIDLFFMQNEVDNGFGYVNYYSMQNDTDYFENYIFTQVELYDNLYDFSVNIYTGDASQANLNILISRIEKMRLSGTKYKINYL